jgi:hypothetical protein
MSHGYQKIYHDPGTRLCSGRRGGAPAPVHAASIAGVAEAGFVPLRPSKTP